MKSHHTLLATALLLGGILLVIPAVRAADQTAIWNGTNGSWSDGTKWSTNPNAPNNGGSTYDAVLNSGVITLNISATIEKFTMTGGSLQGGGTTQTFNDLFTFSGGSIFNGGTVNANGGVLFNTASTKTLNSGRVLNIGDGLGGVGSVTASHIGGQIDLIGGSSLNVQADAAFTTNFDGTIQGFTSSGPNSMSIASGGSFTKSGGTGTSFITGLLFHNNGTVNVQTGTLHLENASFTSTHSGTFNLGSGTTLILANGHALNGTASFTGAGGTVTMSGTVTANGTHAVAPTLTLTGTLQGNGTVNVNNAATWSSGLMASAGTTNILSSLALNTASTKTLETGRILNIGDGAGAAASVTASHTAGVFAINGGATMNITSDSAFTTNFDGTMNNTGAGSPGVINIAAGGSFTKSGGSGTTAIGTGGVGHLLLHNSGTVNVQTGTLHIGKDGLVNTHTGAFDLSTGTTLNLAGTHTLNSGTTLSGAGGALIISGIVNANTTLAVPMAMTLTGTLQGGGTVNAAGAVTWSSGLMNSAGTTNILSSIALGTASTKTLQNGRILNIGDGVGAAGSVTATHTGGVLAINGSASLNVKSDGAFTTNFDGTIQNTSAGTPTTMTIESGGSFTKNGGSGSTIIGGGTGTLDFSNQGTVHVATGTLSMGNTGNEAYNQSGPSSFTILESGTVLATSSLNLNGGTLKGNGTVQGNVIAGASSTIAPGLSPGALTVNGNVNLGINSTLAMELGGMTQGSLYDYLDVNGVLTLAGMLDLDFINDFQNALPGNEILTLATANSDILGSFSNVASGGYLLTNYPISLQVWYGAGSPFGAENLVVAIPEPSRALLMLGGLFGWCLRRRRAVPAKA